MSLDLKKEAEEQKKVAEGTRAENLLASEDFEIVRDFIEAGSDRIKSVLAGGISNDIDENGNVIRKWEEKYWEYVGKHQALSSIELYLSRKIAKKDAIIQKRDASQNGEVKSK